MEKSCVLVVPGLASRGSSKQGWIRFWANLALLVTKLLETKPILLWDRDHQVPEFKTDEMPVYHSNWNGYIGEPQTGGRIILRMKLG